MEREFDGLGIHGTPEPGAIEFEASIAEGTALTRRTRTPTRLLLTVAEGPAVHARQLADLTATIAATGRAQALDAAERAAAKAQAREQLRRFLAIRPRYLPGGSD